MISFGCLVTAYSTYFILDAGGEVALRGIGSSFDTGIEAQHLPSLTHMTL